MSDKFSIVITTYNRLPFLKVAIQSALNQTFPCEVVVIDDGSNDHTREYVSSLGSRVVYHRNRFNQGCATSVNMGVELARGNWIKLLDDDDYLSPKCIEEMSKAIAFFPEAAIASCQAIQVDCDRTELDSTLPVGSNKVCHVPQEDIHYRMLIENLPFGTTVQVAFRKDAFLKAGGWNTDLPIGGCKDIDSWVRIAQYGDAVFVNQPLSYRTLSLETAAKRLSLKERLEANILLKQKIYPLVHQKYRTQLPERQELHNFLRLHWALVGLKNGSIAQGLQLATQSAIFSAPAWKRVVREIVEKTVRSKVVNFDDTLGARLKRSEPVAIEYYHLATRPLLSESEADRVGKILEKAEDDLVLSLLLTEVDRVIAKEFGFLEEDDPAYYQEQREKILAGILKQVTVFPLQGDAHEGDREFKDAPIPAKVLVFDYLREP